MDTQTNHRTDYEVHIWPFTKGGISNRWGKGRLLINSVEKNGKTTITRGPVRLQLNDAVYWGGEECFRLNGKFSPSLETSPTTWISETPGDLFQRKLTGCRGPASLHSRDLGAAIWLLRRLL